MLNTFTPFAVAAATGVSKTMAEASELMLGEPSPHCPHKEKAGLESPERDSTDLHKDSLQRLLKKAALQSQQNFNWSHPAASRTPQNLFLEGFRDCASEVIRFLTQEENVDDNSPLLVGLQSHLANVTKTFCHESVADLDQQDCAGGEQLKYGGLSTTNVDADNNAGQFYTPSPFSLCLISPIAARSVNSSLSDTSAVESDMSVSISSGKDHLSSSSEANSSLCNTSAEVHDESFIDSNKIDDVFHSPDANPQDLTSCYVLPLRVLSVKALQNKNHPRHVVFEEAADIRNHFGHKVIQELSTITSHSRYDTVEESSTIKPHLKCQDTEESSNLNVSSLSCTHTYTYESWNPAVSMSYHPSMNHSSPLPNSSTQSDAFSAHPCHLSQCLCTVSRLEDPAQIQTNSIPQLPTFSEMHGSRDLNPNHSNPGLLLPHQLHSFFQGTEQTHSQSLFQHFVCESSNSNEETNRHSESSPQMHSMLELKSNLFPRIDTSSMVSGDFADVLLAVESCRFHEDPRVRSVAEELVHLIHDDEFEDEDDFDYDDADDDEEYSYNANEVNDVESAVEMLDESAEWASAVDMIEQ